MGFESRAAVKKAARDSWDLPDGSVLVLSDDQAGDLPEGSVPYKMNPDGTLVPLPA
jgi:hypothetical protein